ncbi:MAG: GNAT family N-acetyltransferase [Lachnospiraceae bacterium]|nr:GNAT family N-acetyltransferase [Lachnospiraceae bacterium]
MVIEAKEIQLKDGRRVTVRSPKASDARALLAHMKRTSKETYFMSQYPEEILLTEQEEEEYLEKIGRDADDFMISAFWDGELVGNISVHRIRNLSKYRHRGGLGVSIQERACDMGLGTALLEEALAFAERTSFEQIELGVFSDNPRALHLYEKAGFEQIGRIPRAFKLKDGTYRDEIQMVYRIHRGQE